jgi:NAD(P)-dependent dehydrogenase (short-subunit alcohol dehydrogenase family)
VSAPLPWQGLGVLVTGATSGVGRATVARLATEGASVLAHGRSPERVEALVKELRAAGGTLEGLVADLAAVSDVETLARRVSAGRTPCHVLINNAGVGFGADRKRRETSRDGFELRLAVNYLAPFVLSRALLDGGAPLYAVVNVASIGQEPIDFDDLLTEHAYDGVKAYRRSKVALIMLTLDLAQEYPGVACNALHPGTYLDTEMVRAAGLRPLGTAAQGADAVLQVLATSLTGRTTGKYFEDGHSVRANPQVYDDEVRARLRERTFDWTRAESSFQQHPG